MSLILRDAEVDGRRLDVSIEGETIVAMGQRLPSTDHEIECHGGALLPGLHDHHIHLLSLSAQLGSVDCSPAATPDRQALAAALSSDSHRDGWVRGVLYHESVAGPLDRHRLDELIDDRPVRVQHQSGSLWMLNTRALERVRGVLDASPDVERDARGLPNGRLWRFDDRLRPALPHRSPDLAALEGRLRGLGITGVTDATPDVSTETADMIAKSVLEGSLDLDVTLMGLDGDPPPGLHQGPFKILLRDHDLPAWDELAASIREMHRRSRPVAVHCVTVESLLLTLTVLESVGAQPGDRIEHASVVPDEAVNLLRRTGVAVVTQPDFLRIRGDEYQRSVDPRDLSVLYRHATLLGAGIATAASSDAPFGCVDPWQVIASASSRRTAAGLVLGEEERVSARTALAGYLSPADDPGGPPRSVAIGARADLCLLEVPLAEVLENPASTSVRGTVRRGAFRATQS